MSLPRARHRLAATVGGVVVAYLAAAYVVLPAFWIHHEHLPAMASMPRCTRTPDGLPGDPLNVALIGDEAQVQRAFAAAGWRAARPITFRSGVGIAESVLLDRADPTAPMSTLLLWNRKQDLAFERDVDGSARRRHHVRFWRTDVREGGRRVWLGAATFDAGVELSRRTGQITHRIAPDIDAERDVVIDGLDRAGLLSRIFAVTGIGPTLNGRNGGGDRYYSDGELYVGVLADVARPGTRATRVPSPRLVVLKDGLWQWLRPALTARDDAT